MAALYVLNMSLAVLLLFWPAWFSRARLRLSWVNPFTIVMTTTLPIDLMKLFGGPALLVEEGLFDPAYQFAVLMGSVLLVCQTIGLLVFFRLFKVFRIDRNLPFQNVVLSRRDLRRASRFFLLVFFAALYLLASAEFGVANWIQNPRTGYQLYRTGAGHWYALAITALAASYLLAFLAQPTAKSLLVKTALYIAIGYFLGSKGILLNIFIAMLVFLWFIGSPILKRIAIFGTPVIFGLMLLNLSLAMSDGIELRGIFEYFDYYKNAADYYRAYLAGQLPLFHGDVVFGSLWSYVPRGFWPDKPFVYGITLINEFFYPGQAELTNTPGFGGAVEQFADFGVLGVLGYGLLSAQSIGTALMSYLIFRRPGLRFDRITLATALLMLVQYAPGFGTFFPGLLYFALLLMTLAIIRILSRRRRRRQRPQDMLSIFGQVGPLDEKRASS